MRYRRTIAAIGAAVAVAVGVSGCKSTNALEHEYPATGVVVGSGSSTGSRLVAEIYADALRGTGIAVTTDLGVGDRLDYVRALGSGRISVVPDDTASLLAYFRHTADRAGGAGGADDEIAGDAGADAHPDGAQGSTDPLVAPLSRALPGYLRIGDAARAARTETLVVAEGSAQRLGLRSVSDLSGHCSDLRASFVAGPVSDGQVRSALADVYGCSFDGVALVDTPAQAADAVSAGTAAVAAVPNLSPSVGQGGLTALDDDRGALPSGHIVPLFRAAALQDEQIDVLDTVAGELTSKDLAAMIRSVRVDGEGIDEVVGRWRAQHGS